MSWMSRLANIFRRGRRDRDLDYGLRHHIEARNEKPVRLGLLSEVSLREPRRHFNIQLTLARSSRDVKLFSWFESVLQDARFGLRMLRKNALVTTAAVLSLSFAIGACAAAFSLIDALMIRPLPVRDPAKLFYLKYSGSNAGTGVIGLLFDRLREASHSQADLFGFGLGSHQPAVFDGSGGEEERLEVQLISGLGFRLLGIHPASAGR
jgi:hypothetical protein